MSAVLQPQPRFRPLVESDLAAVMTIERDLYEFPWSPGNFRDSLAAGYSCWALTEGRALIGYAVLMLGAGEAHLLNLSIGRSEQRKGYGTRLLHHLLAVTRRYGASRLFLEVRPSNAAARALYARDGFAEVGVRRGYYPARSGREDALVLSLPL
ncbi:MAG: ribosomal protein S18-alanine N-acetyltransferase [Burkholderiales bacterium]|nr:ribosomal protein S18-alanine N-acetyltransferase [Burkholderiales bacterium]